MPPAQHLPRVEEVAVHLRDDLTGRLIPDDDLLVEEGAAHEEVDALAVQGVGEVNDGVGGTEVEFAFDFEDALA